MCQWVQPHIAKNKTHQNVITRLEPSALCIGAGLFSRVQPTDDTIETKRQICLMVARLRNLIKRLRSNDKPFFLLTLQRHMENMAYGVFHQGFEYAQNALWR